MSSGQSGSGTAAQRKAEKITLAGASSRQRKRNQVVPFEPRKFVAGLLPCVERGQLDEFAARLDEAEKEDTLNLKRYGELFWDVLIAGGAVSSGGEIGDGENPPASVCAFTAEAGEEFDEVFELLITATMQRRPFMRPVLESTFARLALFVTSFTDEQVDRLALVMGKFYAANSVPAQFLVALRQSDRLVERGNAIEFAAKVMRVVLEESSLEKLLSALKLAKVQDSISELFPTRQREAGEVQQFFTDKGLPAFAKYLQDSKVRETLVLVQGLISAESTAAEVAAALKAEVAKYEINNATAVSIVYKAVVSSVPYSKRTSQHVQQFTDHFKTYAKILKPYATTKRIQVDLINRIQVECHDRQGLIKSFAGVIQLLYNLDVVSEDAVLIWNEGGPKMTVASKGREEAVENLAPFVEWLQSASEEESDEDDE
jgi:hypothetical protein